VETSGLLALIQLNCFPGLRRLGAVFAAAGIFVLSGLDETVETVLVEASPQWLTDLTARF